LEYSYEYDQLKPIGFTMHGELDGFFFTDSLAGSN